MSLLAIKYIFNFFLKKKKSGPKGCYLFGSHTHKFINDWRGVWEDKRSDANQVVDGPFLRLYYQRFSDMGGQGWWLPFLLLLLLCLNFFILLYDILFLYVNVIWMVETRGPLIAHVICTLKDGLPQLGGHFVSSFLSFFLLFIHKRTKSVFN